MNRENQMRSVIRTSGPIGMSGMSGGPGSNYPKIKQGFIVDSGGEIILDSRHLANSAGSLMMKRDIMHHQMFVIKIEPRGKCGLHNKYHAWINKCEEEIREAERKRIEEKEEL